MVKRKDRIKITKLVDEEFEPTLKVGDTGEVTNIEEMELGKQIWVNWDSHHGNIALIEGSDEYEMIE